MSLATLTEREDLTNLWPSRAQGLKFETRELTALPEKGEESIGEYPSVTPLWLFHGATASVVSLKPVAVRHGKGETLFFAENENLDIYATGESLREAIQEFSEILVHFYGHYSRLPWDRVMGEASRLKGIYEELFREV